MLNHPILPRTRFRPHHILVGVLTALLFVLAAKQDVFRDHFQHANFAELLAHKVESPPHFVYHLLVILVNTVTSFSFLNSGFVVIGLSVFFTFLFLMEYLQLSAPTTYRAPLAVLCLALFFLHPIPLLYWRDKHLYYGYMAPNIFHNPTVILLKPLALLHFMMFTHLIKESSYKLKNVILLGLLTGVSILAKPSYMMTLLPAAVLIWLFSLIRNKRFSNEATKLITLGLVLPTVALIGWQFFRTFGPQGADVTRWNKGKLVFSPLELFSYYSSTISFIPKVLGSLAFPLSIVFFHLKTAKRSFDFQLALVNMLVAAVFNYCLVDKGGCFLCGDFGWSSQIALFLLNCVSLKIFFQSIDFSTDGFTDTRAKLAIAIPMALFTLHFISGAFWYSSNLFPSHFTP
jgi:hypothetical protein